MSSSGEKCKLVYAADGTLICDPKKYNKAPIFVYEGTPTISECPNAKCTMFGKVCIKNNVEK
jgi:hypothetical protein